MSVSSDGRYLATTESEEENQDIWIYDLQHPGTPRRLTNEANDDEDPVFTPDGARVLYVHGESLADVEIRMRGIDGRGGSKTLTQGRNVDLSADGQWIVFERAGVSFRTSLYYMPIDASAEAQVLVEDDVASLSNPRFSPDGRYVVYENSDEANLFLVSFPDGEDSWQVTTQGGLYPRWSAEGPDVFYVNEGDVMRIRIDTDPEVKIGLPQRVVAREAITPLDSFVLPSPRGDRVLVQRALDPRSSRPRIRLVQNWHGGTTP